MTYLVQPRVSRGLYPKGMDNNRQEETSPPYLSKSSVLLHTEEVVYENQYPQRSEEFQRIDLIREAILTGSLVTLSRKEDPCKISVQLNGRYIEWQKGAGYDAYPVEVKDKDVSQEGKYFVAIQQNTDQLRPTLTMELTGYDKGASKLQCIDVDKNWGWAGVHLLKWGPA